MGYDSKSFETDKDAEIERLKALVASQDDDIAMYKSEHVRLIVIKDTLRMLLNESNILAESLADNCDTLRARVEELEADKQSLLNQRAERNTIILELRTRIEELEAVNKDLSELFHDANTGRHEGADDLITMAKERDKLRARVGELEGTDKARKALYDIAYLELRLSQTCRDEAVDQLAQCEKERDYLDKENNDLRNDGMQLRARVEELEDALNTEIGHSIRYEKERDELRTTLKDLTFQRDANAQFIDELREKLAASEYNVECFKNKAAFLEDMYHTPKQPTIDDAVKILRNAGFGITLHQSIGETK